MLGKVSEPAQNGRTADALRLTVRMTADATEEPFLRLWVRAEGSSDRPTFFRSAAACLQVPGAQNRHFKRSPAGSAGGPAYGTRSAAAKSYAAGHCMCSLNRCDGDLRCKMR